jgi:hypothetical protein
MESLWPVVLALHLPQLAVFGSVLLTVTHALEESFGDGAPLWDDLTEPFGFTLSYPVGLFGFGLLALGLSTAAIYGYRETEYQTVALSILCGARLGDSVWSHFVLALRRPKPNAGIYTALACFAEGVILVALFREKLDFGCVLAGALPFWLICYAGGVERKLQSETAR